MSPWIRREPPGGGRANENALETGYVVLDTELTGLDPKRDSIIAVGAVRMTGTRIELGSAFNRLARPESVMSAESIRIHQITPGEVASSPDLATVLRDFVDFCRDDILVGFCLRIDLEFLNPAVKRTLGAPLANRAIDILFLYQRLRQKLPGYLWPRGGEPRSLYDLARLFDVPVKGAHDAISDAYITAQVFQRVLTLYSDRGEIRLDDLLHTGNPFRQPSMLQQGLAFSGL